MLLEALHAVRLTVRDGLRMDVLHSLEALSQLTGHGPAELVPGQKSPPAGMPLPYTSCATLLPSPERAAWGRVCSRLYTSQDTVKETPTIGRQKLSS